MFHCELDELANAYRKCVVDGQIRAELWGEGAMSDLYPLWMLKYLPNMVACHAAIALDARGPNNTITLDEVSSLLAVIEAVCIIQRGAADVMIAGGSGTRVNLNRMLYRGDRDWSHRSDDPAAALAVLSTPTAMAASWARELGAFILERREFAEARGAKILARVLGFGRSHQHNPATGSLPTGGAIANSIDGALRSAGLAAGPDRARQRPRCQHDRP
jgi:3-oxoacyl-[acyl-carrier-protein] synthase II